MYPLHFSRRFTEKVWSLHIDTENKTLLIERRNRETMQIWVEIVDLKSTKTLIEKELTEAEWEFSIAGITKGFIIMSGFDEQSTYTLSGSIAVLHPENFSVIWRNNQVNLLQIYPDSLLVRENNSLSDPFYLSIHKGKKINPANVSLIDKNTNKYPGQFAEEQPYYTEVKDYIENKTKNSAVGTIEYMEWGAWILISYYIRNEKGLANFLLLTNRINDIKIIETLDEKLELPSLNHFFVSESYLIFVKDNKEVKVYHQHIDY